MVERNGGAKMEAKLVKMGNSYGVRIPKAMRLGAGLKDKVVIEQKDNRIIISTPAEPRVGWAAAAAEIAALGEDELLLPDVFADEDFVE